MSSYINKLAFVRNALTLVVVVVEEVEDPPPLVVVIDDVVVKGASNDRENSVATSGSNFCYD